jgi:hypothetical protein
MENLAMNPVYISWFEMKMQSIASVYAEFRAVYMAVNMRNRKRDFEQTSEHVTDGTGETGSNNINVRQRKTASSGNFNAYKLSCLLPRGRYSVVSTAMKRRARRFGLRIPKPQEVFLFLKTS